MRPKEILVDPVAVDADGLAEAQTVLAATTLNLDGALIVDGSFTGDYARQLSITSSGNDSGITFTVVGTDADGRALTEAITGGATTTVESAEYFKTVASITTSGAAAANVSVGTVDEFVTNTIPLSRHNSDPATVAVAGVTGTISVSIEQTFSELQFQDDFVFFACHADITTITADGHAELSNHATGVRLVCGSYTTGAELKMLIIENRR